MLNDEYIIYGYYANVCKCLPSIDNLPKIPGPIKCIHENRFEKFDGLLRRIKKSERRLWSFTLRGVSWCRVGGGSPTHPAGPRAADVNVFFAKSENSIWEPTCLNGLLFISGPSMIY